MQSGGVGITLVPLNNLGRFQIGSPKSLAHGFDV